MSNFFLFKRHNQLEICYYCQANKSHYSQKLKEKMK